MSSGPPSRRRRRGPDRPRVGRAPGQAAVRTAARHPTTATTATRAPTTRHDRRHDRHDRAPVMGKASVPRRPSSGGWSGERMPTGRSRGCLVEDENIRAIHSQRLRPLTSPRRAQAGRKGGPPRPKANWVFPRSGEAIIGGRLAPVCEVRRVRGRLRCLSGGSRRVTRVGSEWRAPCRPHRANQWPNACTA